MPAVLEKKKQEESSWLESQEKLSDDKIRRG